MSEVDAIGIAKQATADFWEKFFNEKDMTAFDRFASKTYQQNGSPSADGAYLKQWVQGITSKYDLTVKVDRLIGAEMMAKLDDGAPRKVVTVCIDWTATGEPHDRSMEPLVAAGMNVLYFEGDRVLQNWHCTGPE